MIYIVRDPIQRILSHFHHNISKGRESRNIDEALSYIRNNNYISYSKYYMQIKLYLKYFSKDQILILESEDLYKNRIDVLKRVLNFLEVDDTFSHNEFKKVLHQSKYKRVDNIVSNYFSGRPLFEKTRKLFPESLDKLIFQEKVTVQEFNTDLKRKILSYLEKDIEVFRYVTGLELKNWIV